MIFFYQIVSYQLIWNIAIHKTPRSIFTVSEIYQFHGRQRTVLDVYKRQILGVLRHARFFGVLYRSVEYFEEFIDGGFRLSCLGVFKGVAYARKLRAFQKLVYLIDYSVYQIDTRLKYAPVLLGGVPPTPRKATPQTSRRSRERPKALRASPQGKYRRRRGTDIYRSRCV